MKTEKTRKLQTNKTNYMSDEAFAELKQAMEDALAFKNNANSSSAPTQGNVIQGDCSDPTKTQLLSNYLCDDAEYQP
jgi:hypothetical protein